MSMYEVVPDLFADRLKEVRFIQTGLPYAVINKEESYGQRQQRQARRTRKPRLNKTVCRTAMQGLLCHVSTMMEEWMLVEGYMAYGRPQERTTD